MGKQLIFGTDPEFFASRRFNEKDFVVPPVFFRTKLGVTTKETETRHPVYRQLDNGVKIHEDGVAFEFSVTPANSISKLMQDIRIGLDNLHDLVNRFGYNVCTKPTINFDTEEFINEGDDFQYCLMFGCDPDFDAFEVETQSIDDVSKHPFRYGGGHIHISGSDLMKKYMLPAVKLLASTLGCFVVSQSQYPDLDRLRTFRYGRPGKFRPQQYPNGSFGIEYRTPSNAWCTNTNIAEGMEYWIEKAILHFLPQPKIAKRIMNDYGKDVIDGILTADQEKCKQILSILDSIS
jgi:hypothetical protein